MEGATPPSVSTYCPLPGGLGGGNRDARRPPARHQKTLTASHLFGPGWPFGVFGRSVDRLPMSDIMDRLRTGPSDRSAPMQLRATTARAGSVCKHLSSVARHPYAHIRPGLKHVLRCGVAGSREGDV